MRLELTRKTDLALRVLRALEGNGRVSRTILADQAGTSPQFLARVMSPLVKANLVESRPGTAGGYALMSDPCSISVLELIEIMEGPVVNGRCVLQGGECPADGNCSLHAAWSRAREALMEELDATAVADCQ